MLHKCKNQSIGLEAQVAGSGLSEIEAIEFSQKFRCGNENEGELFLVPYEYYDPLFYSMNAFAALGTILIIFGLSLRARANDDIIKKKKSTNVFWFGIASITLATAIFLALFGPEILYNF